MDNQLLSESAAGIFYTSVKSDIDALTEEINSDLEIAADETNKSSLENVKTLLGEQQENYTQIIAYSQTEGTNIADLKSRLDELSLVSSALQADLEKLESRPMLSQEQLSAWQNQHQKLTKTLRQQSTYVRYTLLGLVILVLGGIAGTLAIYLNSIGKNKNGAIEPGFSTVKTFSRKDLKADKKKTAIADDNEKYGMAFSGSSSITMVSDNPSKPNLQIGRIGQRMGLVPIEEDFSLGTGILISERHVLTNLHVYTDNKQYLIADFLAKLGYLEHGELCWGIELEAFESSGGHTNFRAFDGAPPVPLEGFDLAIFRLAKPFTEFRETEEFLERPRPEIDDLIGRKIRVDGYPDWPDFSNDELRRSEQLAAYGHVKSFAVRQSSKGSVFVPKDFTNSVLTYDHQLLGPIPVICHNASTLPGCSGAPVYDDESGELLGIHFRGLQKFGGEQANLAMPIGPILEALEGIDFGL
jgi:hypothetical protein